MNLVAKEFCACQVENRGVLILSEFAGAASDLSSSVLLVNPYDVDAVADAIHEAFCMDAGERQRRMVHLRQIISRNDVYRWADSFLRAAAAVHLPRIIRARPVGRAA
jgi:trehalose 6-phosphate synthase